MRGDIALIDHLDIDRVSAEELIAAGAVAVLNCSPSSGGTYPNLGPAAAGRGRDPARRPARRRRCSTCSPTATRVRAARRAAPRTRRASARRCCAAGELLARGDVLDLAARARRDRGAPARGRRGARALRPQHDRAHARGARAAGRAGSSCRASPPTSATARRWSSSAASATSATCARCGRSSATCAR